MNRSQRRIAEREAKKNPVPSNTITSKQMIKILDNEFTAGSKHAVRGMSAAIGYVLKDKFDFDPDNLRKVFRHLDTVFKDICNKHLDLDDIEGVLREECGIDIKEELEGGKENE